MPHRSLATPIALLTLFPLLGGCLTGTPSPAGGDGGGPGGPDAGPDPGPLSVRSIEVRDLTGRPWSLDDAPQRPRIELELTQPLAEPDDARPETIFLLEGGSSADLVEDLEREPLRRANEARRVDVEVVREGTRVTVTPAARLAPDGRYTVAVAGWTPDLDGRRLVDPFVVDLRVAPGARGGSQVRGSWPADGSAGVPPVLPLLGVRLDGPAEGLTGVRLVDAHGAEVPATPQVVACETIGWVGGQCVALRPDVSLAPDTDHRLEIGPDVVDPTGAPVGPWVARFRTGGGADGGPPRLSALPCALDEEDTPLGCLLRDDHALVLRVRADRPARLWLSSEAASTSTVAARGDATLRLDDLAPDTPYGLTLRLTDLAGTGTMARLDTATHPPLAPVAITEVRADARGPEPAQEYVEIANLGAEPLDLGGFALADDPGREGDRFAEGTTLPAGGRALVVADGFDPSGAEDEPVPPGVPLVRVGSSLGSGGLTNAGEPLFLRDAGSRRVSAAPAVAAPGSGWCLVRVATDPRRGDEAAFAPDAEGGCTPGRADRLP